MTFTLRIEPQANATLAKTWYAWAALLNVFSDIAIIIIPIPLVLRLQMPNKQKFASLTILTTGIMCVS